MDGASDPRFRALIERVGARAFDESRDVIYGLWPDLRLAYTNAAWTKFARENDGEVTLGAWGLGRSVPEAFGPALEGFYARAFSEALARGTVWEHTYSCPSPDVNRWYAMRVLPIEGQGLMVCHSLVAEEAFKQRLLDDEATGFDFPPADIPVPRRQSVEFGVDRPIVIHHETEVGEPILRVRGFCKQAGLQ